jgi:hypothetical protein
LNIFSVSFTCGRGDVRGRNFLLTFSLSTETAPVGGYSSVPSSSPTDITSAPSPSPTDKPTNKPTDKPTNKPSTVPSSSPSTTPLITPSITSPTPNTPSENDADFTDPVNDGDGSGVDSVNGEEDPVSVDGDNSDLGTGPVIGIAAAAAACLLLCVLVACRRRFDDDEEPHKELRDVECDGSVSTEGAPNLKFLDGFQMDAMADTGDKGSIASSQSSFNRRSILQFDPLHAAAIAMGKRVDDSSSAPSSIFNRSGVSGTTSAAQITKAIDKANWDEVYNLASQLAEQEDLSTLSSIGRQNSKLSSTTSELSSKIRDALSPQDQERTRALDQLVDYGDWTGVAVTAALYAGESGSMSGSIPSTQRSFLDLLTGKRGTSNAAAAATDQDTLSALPVPFGNALGTFTDETRSATTDEPGSFDLYSPSWTQPAPSSPVLRAFTTPPAKTKRARTSKGASPPGIVTAFSSSSSGNPSVHTSNSAAALGPLKGDIDRAVEAGDWEKVLILSSQVESNATYQANLQAPSTPVRDSIVSTPERASASGDVETSEPTTASLKEELSMAVYHGDWALVSFFANRIMSNRRKGTDQDGTESATSSTIVPQSTALVPFGIQAARSIDTTDTEAGKKKTIERLVLAEKWNGVVIMAGLYDLESKGSLPTSDARSRALVQRDNAGEAVSDGKSAGWTDILDRSNEEITPNELKSPDNQISPPPQFEKEKVHLRKVARKFPESQQHQSENVEVEQASLENRKFGSSQVPPTELRHADRVTGDISLAQLTAAPLREAEVAEKVVKRDSQNRASLHGTQELIPYWQKREAKNASDDAKPAAK